MCNVLPKQYTSYYLTYKIWSSLDDLDKFKVSCVSTGASTCIRCDLHASSEGVLYIE